MTTIAAGESLTNIVAGGFVVTITASGGRSLVERMFEGVVVEQVVIDGEFVLGPYHFDMTYRVACIDGSVSVSQRKELSAQSVKSGVVSNQSNLFSALIAARPNNVPLRYSTLGNSIYAGVSGISVADQAAYAAGDVVRLIHSGGIAGNTSAMMLARINSDVPQETQACTFMEGANDAGAGVSVRDHRNNMESIIQNLISRGIAPVLDFTSPVSGNVALASTYLAAQQALVWKYGISGFDQWLNVIDVATGTWAAGNTSDGIHPLFDVGVIAKSAKAEWMRDGAPAQAWAPRSNVSGTANYCLAGSNCFMLSDANTDGVPDGWTKAGTASAEVATAPAGYRGNFVRITGTTATGNPYLRKVITAGWLPGDDLLISFAMESAAGGLTGGSSFLTVKVDGVEQNIMNGASGDIDAQRMMFWIKPKTLSQIEFYAKINGAGTGNYIGIGEFEIYNVTALLSR